MYEVTVVVTDSRANAGTRNVTVQVTNDEEDGAVVVSLLHPQVGTMLVASLSDPDGNVSGVEWQWWRTTDGDGTDAAGSVGNTDALTRTEDEPGTDWEKAPGGTSSSYRPVPGDTGKFLLAVATYADGKEEHGGRSRYGSSSRRVRS